MSSTIIYILNSKSVSRFAAFKNSWGTAPIAYEYLLRKYAGPDLPHVFDWEKHINGIMEDDRLEGDELIAMLFMADRAYIPLERLAMAAEACEMFGARLPERSSGPSQDVNHWPQIARTLRDIAAAKLSRHAVGVCMAPTDGCDEWQWSKGLADNAWPIFKPMRN